MNSKKKFIEQIKQNFENEKNTKSYARVQRMAKTISENLYSEDSHFIYELIQNAQDNTYNVKTKKLDFFVYDDGILTKNNEKGFNEENIESICDFNDSTKSKKKALGYIGEKGIGFKSVFSITDAPAIHSNSYQFYFKKDEYIEPYWIDTLDNYPNEFQDTTSTNIYLPYSKTFNNKEDIEKKIRDIEAILLLFLDNLDEINIYQDNKQLLFVKKEIKNIDNNQKIVTIISDNQEDKFVTFSKEIICNSNIKEEKREGVERRKLIIAFPLNKIEDTRLFAFLPTEVRTGLPFLIQADFLLTASRGDILKDKEWNKWLLDEIVVFFIQFFKNLREINKYEYLHYLDEQRSEYDFIDFYYQKILDQLKEEQLFLSTESKFVTSSQICILNDYDFMYHYLKNIDYQNELGETFFYADKEFYIPQYLIEQWKINTITKDDFLRIIGENSDYFSKLFKEDNSLFEKLIEYIGTNYFMSSDYLFNIPIIPFDQNDRIVFKTKNELEDVQLFFKLDDEGVLNDVFPNLKVISKSYQEYLQDFSFYSNRFDIKKPNIVDILRSLRFDEDFFTNIENNVNLLVYIKNHLQDNKQEIIELLAQYYRFFSKKNNLIKHKYNNYTSKFSTQLYISQEYLNSKNCIEKIVDRYCTNQGKENIEFISEKYLEYDKKISNKDIKTLRKEWNEFFNELKINDDIKLETQTLEMWAFDSRRYRREISESIVNIPFIAFAIYERYSAQDKVVYLDTEKLNKKDSIFLFNKIIQVSTPFEEYDLSYLRVTGFKGNFESERTYLPWVDILRNVYPIYIEDKQYTIKKFYLEVDKKFEKYFHSLPKDYRVEKKDTLINILKIKEKPSYQDIIELIDNKKVQNFQDIKSLFLYIHHHYGHKIINLKEIPINQDSKIKYIQKNNLIWKKGKELGLEELEVFYGAEFKEFFLSQVGVAEKPTLEQYINHLKTNPKNYKKIFYNFISELNAVIEEGEKPDIEHKKIVLCGNVLFSFEEIIFNDEDIKTTNISNLFYLPQKYFSIFQTIVNRYKISSISEYSREIKISNDKDDEKIQDIYIKLLHYTWDYIFSKDKKEFDNLKNNREFILETKNVTKGSIAEIILQIDVNGKNINIELNIAINDEVIYLAQSVDEREYIKEIAQFISSKLDIEFSVIERFYDKVYKYKEYSKEEYYTKEKIEEPKDNDRFDNVFDILLNMSMEENLSDITSREEESEKDIDSSADDEQNNNENDVPESVNPPRVKKQTHTNPKPKTIKCPICGLIESDDTLKDHLCKEHNSHCQDQTKTKKENKAKNAKTICPECNCEVNKKNLEKHLCREHQINCKNGAYSSNNQNVNQSVNPIEQVKSHNKNVKEKQSLTSPSIVTNKKQYLIEQKERHQRLENEFEKKIKALNTSEKMSNTTKQRKRVLNFDAEGSEYTRNYFSHKKVYSGNCQVCGFTFSTIKGFYFERFAWTDFRKIKWTRDQEKTNTYKLIEPGNSLCLCAKCHSIIKGGGDFEALFLNNIEDKIKTLEFDAFLEEINSVKLGEAPECFQEHIIFEDMYALEIRLNNKIEKLYFVEEHLLDFYIFLTSK